MSQAGSWFGGGGGGGGGTNIQTITGNTGGPVGPNGSNNINLVGTDPITITGNAGTFTETVSVATATFSQLGVVQLATDGQTIAGVDTMHPITPSNLTAKLGTQTPHAVLVSEGTGSAINAVGPGLTNQVLIGNTGADPSWGAVPSGALPGNVATSYAEDSGSAIPSGNSLTIAGGANISTSGSGNTVTINVAKTTNHSLQVGTGTTGLTQLGVATNGQLPIGSNAADPVLATLTAGANITITNGAGSITIAADTGSETIAYTGVNHAASPYTVLSTDYYISADVTGGVITILLPNAPATGRVFIIKDKVGLAATSNITVTTVGGTDTIDGVTSFVMNTAYEAIEVVYNGSNYEIF